MRTKNEALSLFQEILYTLRAIGRKPHSSGARGGTMVWGRRKRTQVTLFEKSPRNITFPFFPSSDHLIHLTDPQQGVKKELMSQSVTVNRCLQSSAVLSVGPLRGHLLVSSRKTQLYGRTPSGRSLCCCPVLLLKAAQAESIKVDKSINHTCCKQGNASHFEFSPSSDASG